MTSGKTKTQIQPCMLQFCWTQKATQQLLICRHSEVELLRPARLAEADNTTRPSDTPTTDRRRGERSFEAEPGITKINAATCSLKKSNTKLWQAEINRICVLKLHLCLFLGKMHPPFFHLKPLFDFLFCVWLGLVEDSLLPLGSAFKIYN